MKIKRLIKHCRMLSSHFIVWEKLHKNLETESFSSATPRAQLQFILCNNIYFIALLSFQHEQCTLATIRSAHVFEDIFRRKSIWLPFGERWPYSYTPIDCPPPADRKFPQRSTTAIYLFISCLRCTYEFASQWGVLLALEFSAQNFILRKTFSVMSSWTTAAIVIVSTLSNIWIGKNENEFGENSKLVPFVT